MSDTLDDLAAFLMHRTAEGNMSEKRRLSIFVLIDAYQEQDDPPMVEAALRNEAGSFADHPAYRAEWAVRDGEENITIERLIAGLPSGAAPTPEALTQAPMRRGTGRTGSLVASTPDGGESIRARRTRRRSPPSGQRG